jgi:hypothetical protein
MVRGFNLRMCFCADLATACCAAVCLLFVMSMNNNFRIFGPVHICADYTIGHLTGVLGLNYSSNMTNSVICTHKHARATHTDNNAVFSYKRNTIF